MKQDHNIQVFEIVTRVILAALVIVGIVGIAQSFAGLV